MDSTALPNIGPAIDYTKVRSLHQKRTLAFINNFIFSTISLLNHFSQSCEIRLELFEGRIQKLEASLSILEAKLSSIPGLNDMSVKNPEISKPVEIENDPPETNSGQNQKGVATETETETETNNRNKIKVSKHATYEKYFRMLAFGVPIDGVKQKMQTQGLDPSILDNSDAEIFECPEISEIDVEIESENSSSSFSD